MTQVWLGVSKVSRIMKAIAVASSLGPGQSRRMTSTIASFNLWSCSTAVGDAAAGARPRSQKNRFLSEVVSSVDRILISHRDTIICE